MKSRMRGFTLIEMLLASFAVLTAFYFLAGFVQSQSAAAKSNRLAGELTVFRDRTRAAYANAPNYSLLTHSEAIDRKLVPQGWVTVSGIVIEFGPVLIAPGMDGDSFTVTLPPLPIDVCIGMLPIVLQTGVTTLTSGGRRRIIYVNDEFPLVDRGAVTREACSAQSDLMFEFI